MRGLADLPLRMQRLIEPEPNTGCWLSSSVGNGCGYTLILLNRRRRMFHRVVYQLLVGPVSDELQMDHLCRVRCCVNPQHLRPVTARENLMAPGSLSPVKRNAEATHCVKGHPFDAKNTKYEPRGKRRCRACANRRTVAWQRANRERHLANRRQWAAELREENR